MGLGFRLLLAPAFLVLGMLMSSIGVGLFDYRIGLVVGGAFVFGSGFFVASLLSRMEERKNVDSR